MSKMQPAINEKLDERLTEDEIGKVYAQVLHRIARTSSAGIHSAQESQSMADAVGDFYQLLTEAIGAKAAPR